MNARTHTAAGMYETRIGHSSSLTTDRLRYFIYILHDRLATATVRGVALHSRSGRSVCRVYYSHVPSKLCLVWQINYRSVPLNVSHGYWIIDLSEE